VENEESYLQSEQSGLGIESKQKNKFNNKKDLEAVVTAIKKSIFKVTIMMVVMKSARKKLFTKNFTLYDRGAKYNQIRYICLCACLLVLPIPFGLSAYLW
jgi:hypothetical protein